MTAFQQITGCYKTQLPQAVSKVIELEKTVIRPGGKDRTCPCGGWATSEN